MNQTKKCFTCHKVKPLSEYHTNKANKDGLHGVCKHCKKIYVKEYQLKQREILATSPVSAVQPPQNLAELQEYRDKKFRISQDIVLLTERIGRLAATIRSKKTSPEALVIAQVQHTEKKTARRQLRTVLQHLKLQEPIPDGFYCPRIVDDEGTTYSFEKYRTLPLACTKRNAKQKKLLTAGKLTDASHQYELLSPQQFQVTASQKSINKKKRAINTKT